jgi:hypothetical protein
MSTQYFCKNQERRDLLKGHTTLNGIDFLEVLDDPGFWKEERQAILVVHLINSPAGPIDLKGKNILIEGGVRIKNLKALWAFPASQFSPLPSKAGIEPNKLVSDKARGILLSLADPDRVLVVRTGTAGDFSIYTLRLVKSLETPTHPDNYDPILSGIDFSFKVECPSEFDCKKEEICPPLVYPEPEIDYLAKDYTSFRRIMLDRLSVSMPGWQERNAADMQVALVEVLAYVGDHLSYYQDAVATETYLGTARKRISVRRHARLVDYFMHDGCNARAWVHLRLDAGTMTVPVKTKLLTRCTNAEIVIDPGEAKKIIAQQKPVVFETMFKIELSQAHNEMKFYTWGDSQCCLPRGAVKATLIEDPLNPLNLTEGDFLVFEEVKSPVTGGPEDSDPTHRHVVRLTGVEHTIDPLDGTPVVNIQWHEEDALPIPFCISAIITEGSSEHVVPDVSIARGNLVLADHGRTVTETDTFTPGQIANRLLAPLWLRGGPVTCCETYNPDASAASVMNRRLDKCSPVVVLMEDPGGAKIQWESRKDLLSGDEFSEEFVLETESDGRAYVRFGDGEHGKEPGAEEGFGAEYRVGNGTEGNVGAGALFHIVSKVGGITGVTEVRNPLPALGGVDMETNEEARQFAPEAFRVQERAVTEQDYADVAMRFPGIQKAVATFQWTGSWTTVFLVVDREQGKPVQGDPQFKEDLLNHMEKYRMAGFDLELADPVYVPLDIVISVCVKPGYFKSDIEQALLKVFSSYQWEPGQLGFFHPDNFTFAQPVYLSRIYESAVKVEGVFYVEVAKFERWGKGPGSEIEDGVLTPGRAEIVRLDNDPNYPENGKIEFAMKGGM